MNLNIKMTFDEIFNYVNTIKNNGDLVFIKFDGEREENHITVIISYPVAMKKEQIRVEGEDIKELLIKAIKLYSKTNNV